MKHLHQLILTLEHAKFVRTQLLEAIKATLPYSPSKVLRKNRAGLFPWIGSAVSGLTGLATSDEVEQAEKHVNQIIKKVNQQTEVIQRLASDYSSFVVLSAQHMDKITDTLKTMNEQFGNTTEYLRTQIARNRLNLIEMSIEMATIQHLTSATITEYVTLAQEIQTLQMGKLSSVLISPAVLNDALNHIEEQLEKENSLVHISHLNCDYYYRQGVIVYAIHNQTLYLTFFIPLSVFTNQFHIYTIHSIR